MINLNSDIHSSQIEDDSVLNYIKNKHQSGVTTSTSTDLISTESNGSLDCSARSHNKRKTVLKKTPLYHLPFIDRSHGQLPGFSLNYFELEKHHKHHRSHHQQTRLIDDSDMRFFIIRHGERVDRYFGSNWYMYAFDQFGQYHPYHINLPPNLPNRPDKYFWEFDTPLTRNGLFAAQHVGRVLANNQLKPAYVYSSPAMRCIFTAHEILRGVGLEKKLSIRIEPGLLELGAARFGMNVFLKPIDWHNYGLNIDLSYRPIMTDVVSTEREDAYYLRSKYIIREIEQRHVSFDSPLLNILIVAHATSPETLTWDLVGRQPNIYDLYALSLNIGYLEMVITERKRQNKLWSLLQTPLQSTTIKWV